MGSKKQDKRLEIEEFSMASFGAAQVREWENPPSEGEAFTEVRRRGSYA